MFIRIKLFLSAKDRNFRLLQLDLNGETGDSEEDILHATLDNFGDPEWVDYDALSYCWGPKDESSLMMINGEHFPLSPTLLAAIKQLQRDQREIGVSRKLWIDAVSIDQANGLEKSHQVTLMRDIYANAHGVVIWIGSPDDLSNLAFDTLTQFASDDGTPDGSATSDELQATAPGRRAAIQWFISRPYFLRMWIIQEVLVARKATIRCGALHLDFDKLQTAIQRMTGSGFFPFSAVTTNLTYIGNWRTAYQENRALDFDSNDNLDLRLFLDCRDRSATDARDKIYSLRGIANRALAAGIKVDYDASVERVYTDFSKHVLEIRPDLLILSAVIGRHRSSSTYALPSYVPDWSLPKYGGGVLQRYFRFKPEHLFHAAGDTTPRIRMEKHSDTIGVEGVVIDNVAGVLPIKTLLGIVPVDASRLRELALDSYPTETYQFTGEPSWIAFFRTMTADRTALSQRINDEYRTQFFSKFSLWDLPRSEGLDHIPSSAWDEVSKGIASIIEDKDMFVTARGYLGLGHEGFQVGDTVCVFFGGEVPFLLRKSRQGTLGDREETYQLLSECYVHGIMDGEVIDGALGDSVQRFSIE